MSERGTKPPRPVRTAARASMTDPSETHFHVPRLNVWFAVASVLLLLSVGWMVIDDWNRSWKGYQREFRRIEIERAREALATADARAALDEEARLTEVLARVERELAADHSALDAAEEELRTRRAARFVTTEIEKRAKQEYEGERFRFEQERASRTDSAPDAARLRALELRHHDTFVDDRDAEAAVLAQERTVADLRGAVTRARAAVQESTRGIDAVRRSLEQLDPPGIAARVADFVRDLPGLDFIAPNLEVQKVVPERLTFDLGFASKKRIDMCQTCHLAIDRPGFEDEPQPFRTHPRLDLHLGSRSPHPLADVGCTICHGGAGEALEFGRADHQPFDDEEAARWRDEHGWGKQSHWEYPMRRAAYLEAGCVQCHQDSMELIAAAAPRVFEGFRLFERYGCYACHEVDWFPADRRPGPSLARLRQKTRREFVEAWVSAPRAFRPTTWMPQLFHLENFAADEIVATSEHGRGEPITGDRWNAAAVAAASAFVWDRSTAEPLPPVPVAGDARRGRETFRLVGCLACHNLAPPNENAYDENAGDVTDRAWVANETNVYGPDLRGVATKVTREWLYAWLRDPAAYGSEVRMPDLRLTVEEAADITAYVFEDPEEVFHDTPAGWTPGRATFDRVALEELARRSFDRVPEREIVRRFGAEWQDDEALLRAVGEKVVLHQGCHSCHEIPGLEDEQRIGPPLSTWGSKPVDQLLWGRIPDQFAAARGLTGREAHGWKREFASYRENFVEQKLDAPRSFDRGAIKTPPERLRMPWFDFAPDEIAALAAFAVGLVDDEVARARMVPTPAQAKRNAGHRILRDRNCASCHLLEPGRIEFTDAEGLRREVRGQFLPFEGDVMPPSVGGFAEEAAAYVRYVREEMQDPAFALDEVSLVLREFAPGVGDAGDTVVVEDVESIVTTPGRGGDFVDLVTAYYLFPWSWDPETGEELSATADPADEGRVRDVDGVHRAYEDEPYERIRWAFAPPELTREGAKLRREWFYQFLLDPVAIRQQLRVRMPSFAWRAGEAGAVVDYFAHEAALTRPAESFDPEHDTVRQRQPGHLDPVLDAHPDFYARVKTLAFEGPDCRRCHFFRGKGPTSGSPVGWAPDLDLVRDAIHPDWARAWITDPPRTYPGTAMPVNFPTDEADWQDLWPKSGPDQIEDILTWLYNLDRATNAD